MLHDSIMYEDIVSQALSASNAELDDLHPSAYRCFKNQQWPNAAPLVGVSSNEDQSVSLSQILRDMTALAGEIQYGVTIMVNKAKKELTTPGVEEDVRDLYPAIYRASINAGDVFEEDDPLAEALTTAQATLEGVLHRIKENISTRVDAIKKEMVEDSSAENFIASDDESPEDERPMTPPDFDLYPSLTRAVANHEMVASAPVEADAARTLTEELVTDLKHTVQDLRRKWVHARLQVEASHQPDLYPDVYRYAVNHQSIDRADASSSVVDLMHTIQQFVGAAAA